MLRVTGSLIGVLLAGGCCAASPPDPPAPVAGRLLTLDVKQADGKDVVSYLATVLNRTIWVTGSVPDRHTWPPLKVTLELRDRPWREVLEAVAEQIDATIIENPDGSIQLHRPTPWELLGERVVALERLAATQGDIFENPPYNWAGPNDLRTWKSKLEALRDSWSERQPGDEQQAAVFDRCRQLEAEILSLWLYTGYWRIRLDADEGKHESPRARAGMLEWLSEAGAATVELAGPPPFVGYPEPVSLEQLEELAKRIRDVQVIKIGGERGSVLVLGVRDANPDPELADWEYQVSAGDAEQPIWVRTGHHHRSATVAGDRLSRAIARGEQTGKSVAVRLVVYDRTTGLVLRVEE